MVFSAALIQHEAYDVKSAADGLTRVLNLVDQAAAARPSLVVLPECSYPGYYLGLEGDPRRAAAAWEEALERFRGKARAHRFYMVVGIAETEGSAVYNSAYLIGPDGGIIGRARKTFLWHFDSKWFSAGDEYGVFDTPLGKIGIVICADGRVPEISRVLALKGAQIIVDPTNWVSTGRDEESLKNPQVDHIIPTRALENGVWFLCANKVGREAESVVYCGQSMVVSPDGTIQVKGSPATEEIVTAQITVQTAQAQKALGLRKECFRDEYSLLFAPNDRTPLHSLLEARLTPGEALCHLAVAQLDRDISLQEFLQSSARMARRMSDQGADIIVFPEVPVTVMRDFGSPVKETLLPVSSATGIRIAVTLRESAKTVTAVMEPAGGVTMLGENDNSVIEVNGTRVGFLRGNQGFVPEESRLLFLKGADVVVWQANSSTGRERDTIITRAIENRVYAAFANCSSRDPVRNSLVVSPSGGILAETSPSAKQAVITQISPAESRVKQVVRGTDVFRNRIPSLYGPLSRM